jgi:hypothetical protein
VTIAGAREQGRGWVQPREKAVDLVSIRNRKEIEEQMKIAVSRLESAIKYADPKAWVFDDIEQRTRWGRKLHG